MPKKGFHSVTIKEKVYQKIHEAYEQQKEELRPQGIHSFSQFFSHVITSDKNQKEIDDIKELFLIQNQILFIMADFMLGFNKDLCLENLKHAKLHSFELLKESQKRV